uniref:IgGFc-binding protein n=1 Tax=Magallana gigas TaxID=29159 RepID=K1QDI3_MAGGI
MSDEYYVITWAPPYRQCEMLVIGAEDSTSVTVTIGQSIGSGSVNYGGRNYYRGNVVTETLNKYDTWQLVSTGDLTGSYVKSTKKVAVFSGNKKTKIGSGGSQDHLVEQLTPVDTWGKNFATVPIPKRTVGDYFKFITSEDSTTVTISGGYSSTFTISQKGGMVQKLIPSTAYCKIVADKAIMVTQFVQSQQSSSEPSDPAMLIIPPVEQYGADYTFSTPKYSLGSYENFFMFIVEASEASGLRIDGKAFPTNTVNKAISGTSLVGGYISVSEGTHTVRHTSPIAIFGGFLYGKANLETYGFTTGMRMARVNAVSN